MSDTNTVTIEIAGLQVTLPVKFAPGHVLTENQAKVLDAAYQRQFTNNQNASAKGREEALKKATTDAERAAKAPLSAADIAKLYADYEPSVGGTTRQSTMEKLRSDAAWRVFLARVGDHNESVAKGEAGLFKGNAAGKPFAVPTGKGSVEWRETMVANVLGNAAYTDAVQAEVDLLVADRASKSAKDTKVAIADINASDLM
jgi:hypothetical protein